MREKQGCSAFREARVGLGGHCQPLGTGMGRNPRGQTRGGARTHGRLGRACMHLEHLPAGTQGCSDVHDHPSMALQHTRGAVSGGQKRGGPGHGTLTWKNFS